MSFTSEAYKAEAKMFKGRKLTADKPWTYNEVYNAYRRKFYMIKDEDKVGVWKDMPIPATFHIEGEAERDIAYDEMLKYLSDTEIIVPEMADLEKDMSESAYHPPYSEMRMTLYMRKVLTKR